MFTLHAQLEADCYYLGDFPLCALLLSKDANYPWFIMVPRVPNITEIFQLNRVERNKLLEESCVLSQLLQRVFDADKLNVAALGNVVPQLHLHHIVRFRGDPAWPAPVWGAVPAISYSAASHDAICQRLVEPLAVENFSWRA